MPKRSKDLEYLDMGVEDLVDDAEDVNILQYFIESISYIKSSLQRNEAILVQCDTGISIAPTIVIAYLIKE